MADLLSRDPSELPEFVLPGTDPLVTRVRAIGLGRFRAVARWVSALPFGRNTDSAGYFLVVSERRGTCSTKHALLAHLAREAEMPVQLGLGIYEMTDDNTPGIDEVFSRHGIESMPEAHCFLRADERRFDLTRPRRRPRVPIEAFLHEETIEPEEIGAYKRSVHRRFLDEWAAERGLDSEEAWRIREECIAAITDAQ